MDNNPYAPPRIPANDFYYDPTISVDGDCLVVRPAAELPQRCVITNHEVTDADRCERVLKWAPRFRPVLQSRQCKIAYFVSKDIRQRRLPKNLLRVVLVVLAFLGFPLILSMAVGLVTGEVGVLECLLPSLVVVAVTAPILFACRRLGPIDELELTRFENNRVWIKGFGAEFLASCESENVETR